MGAVHCKHCGSTELKAYEEYDFDPFNLFQMLNGFWYDSDANSHEPQADTFRCLSCGKVYFYKELFN